jgi:hypothetical protein
MAMAARAMAAAVSTYTLLRFCSLCCTPKARMVARPLMASCMLFSTGDLQGRRRHAGISPGH